MEYEIILANQTEAPQHAFGLCCVVQSICFGAETSFRRVAFDSPTLNVQTSRHDTSYPGMTAHYYGAALAYIKRKWRDLPIA